jgi:hypothetical protein
MQVLVVVKNMRSELRIPSQAAFRVGLAIAGAKQAAEKLALGEKSRTSGAKAQPIFNPLRHD